MKSASGHALLTAAVAAFCLPLPAADASAAKITPTQQVINMLSQMKATGEKMMDEEQKTFATYEEWVDDTSKELGFSIQDAAAKIEELAAFIIKADSDVAELGSEIGALEAEINQLSAEKAEATNLRDAEHKEYLKMSTDYAESVDALERAIQVMSSQDYDRAQAEVLLQRMATTVPGMSRVLSAFLQEKGRGGTAGALRGDGGAPAVAAYEFQAGGIVELLEGLLKKFKGELADVEEAESNQAHQFALTVMHLSNTIAKDSSDRDARAVTKGKRAAASAQAKGELAETKAEKAADEKLKSDTGATFKAKKAAFGENQEVRKAELEAIAKAAEIIASPAVANSYAKHVNLAQVHAPQGGRSFLQLRSSKRRVATRQQASEFLAKRASALHSQVLASLAAEVTANPFAKVIGMLEDLLEKLKEEAAAEADHKAWCDEQLKANKEKRNKKTSTIEKLTAEIEALAAKIADQGASIATLAKEQAQLTTAMQEATKLRGAEKTDNLATIKDAGAGIEAIKQALVVLKEFYSSQQSFIQQAPEMAAYKGMQSSKGGVMGMLEVILTDFTRLKAETESSEKAATMEYATFMEDSTKSKEEKHQLEVKTRLDKDQTEFEKSLTEKDLRATEQELAKANEYYESLKPACLQVHVSCEERVARRKEEIEALKEAHKILDQKSV